MKKKPPRRPPKGVQYFNAGPLPMNFGVCFTAPAFAAEMKRLRIDEPNPFVTPGCGATVHSFINDDRTPSLTTIMSLPLDDLRSKSISRVASIIAHEAVHCTQAALDHMEEKTAGEETRAYFTDWFVYCAMDAIMAQKKRGKE